MKKEEVKSSIQIKYIKKKKKKKNLKTSGFGFQIKYVNIVNHLCICKGLGNVYP
jgi:hypothetical protein